MREKQDFLGKIVKPSLLFVVLMIITMIGFYITEGWGPLQSYYSFIQSTFGDWFNNVLPDTTQGKLFATFIDIVAVLIVGYFIATLTALFVEGELKDILKFKKMDKAIENLDKHFIICGLDNVSRHIIDEFEKTNTPYVLIERDQAKCDQLKEQYSDLLYLDDDPAKDEVLQLAGIERARGLVATLHDDHDNLYVVISARSLNPDCKIVSEVINPDAKDKILRAGADETVAPNQIGGLRIASVMIRPTVVTFLDTLLRDKGTTRFEEVELKSGSKLVGKTFYEAQEAEETGLSVIAIRKKEADDYICNPRSEVKMEVGDVLVTLGDLKQKEEFVSKYN